MEDLVIDRNRIRLFFGMLFFASFVLAGLVLMSLRTVDETIIGLLSLAIFFPLTIRFARQTFSKEPWLVLTASGLKLYANPGRPICVNWLAVEAIRYKELHGYRTGRQKVIIIKVKDRDAFLSQFSLWTQLGVRSNSVFGVDGDILLSLNMTRGVTLTSCYNQMVAYHTAALERRT